MAKFGLYNEDVISDLSFGVGFGDYKTIDAKGNLRVKYDGPVDFEAGFELAYKKLDNLWSQLTTKLGAGAVLKFNDDFAAQLALYWRREELDSGIKDVHNTMGIQFIPYGRIYQNKNVKISLFGGIRYEGEEGFGIFGAIGVSTK